MLHLDGDLEYLEKSLDLYKELGIYANGFQMDEKDFSKEIISLIKEYSPDIVILTGHDAFIGEDIKDLRNYFNTNSFMDAIKEIRKVYTKNDLFVYGGACQSHFEALIASGANFASSPKRVNIHAYDPAIIGIICAFTSYNQTIKMEDVLYHTISKAEGIGGVESDGKMRLLL